VWAVVMDSILWGSQSACNTPSGAISRLGAQWFRRMTLPPDIKRVVAARECLPPIEDIRRGNNGCNWRVVLECSPRCWNALGRPTSADEDAWGMGDLGIRSWGIRTELPEALPGAAYTGRCAQAPGSERARSRTSRV
jgi:hypothetical protein